MNRTKLLSLLGAVAIGLGLTPPHPGHAADEKPARTKAGTPRVAYRTVNDDSAEAALR